MRVRNAYLIGLASGIVVWPGLFGCHTAPMSYSAADLQSPETRARAAGLYWQRNNVPTLRERGCRRVAILDFSVEYVTGKIEVPGETQPTFSPPALAPAHVGLEYGGLFRKQINFKEALYRQLADELYAMLVEELVQRGFEVLAPSEVSAAAAYQRLKTRAHDDGSVLQEFNLIGSDTGRIKRIVTYPASGLRIVTGAAEGEIEQVELALLNELPADVSLRVHIRVGVYQRRASLERGSIAWVLTRDVVGNLTADRSLLSDDAVATSQRFLPIEGEAYAVDSERYLEAMRLLFPPYISMAFEAQPQ